MNKNNLVTIAVIAIILLVAGGIIYFKNYAGATIQETGSEEVAKWIGEHSVLYYQPSCSHCVEQEKLFGDNVKYLTMVDCTKSENQQKCIDEGITATPTWIINDEKYAGVQSIEKLKELTGYE